jgi:hypothetical protein
MGGAYASLAGDLSGGLQWNPAGLAFLRGNAFEAAYASMYQGMNQGWLSAGRGLGRFGGVGAGISYLEAGTLVATEADPAGGYSVTGTFKPSSRVVSGGWAWSASSEEGSLAAGAVGKWVEESIMERDAGAGAIDIGVMARRVFGMFSLGAAYQNIGSAHGLAGYRLPEQFRAGLGMERGRWSLGLDFVSPRDGETSLKTGLEVALNRALAVRAGFDSSLGEGLGKYSGIESGFSTGLGLAFGNYTFDYAFVSAGLLGAVHRFGLSARWGGGRPGAPPRFAEAVPAPAAASGGSPPSPAPEPEAAAGAGPPPAVRARARPAPGTLAPRPAAPRPVIASAVPAVPADERYAAADRLAGQGSFAAARGELDAVLRTLKAGDQGVCGYWLRVGRILHLQRRCAEAASHYQGAVNCAVLLGAPWPGLAEAWYGKGMCLLEDGDASGALSALDSGFAADPAPATRERLEAGADAARRRQR